MQGTHDSQNNLQKEEEIEALTFPNLKTLLQNYSNQDSVVMI